MPPWGKEWLYHQTSYLIFFACWTRPFPLLICYLLQRESNRDVLCSRWLPLSYSSNKAIAEPEDFFHSCYCGHVDALLGIAFAQMLERYGSR